MTTVEKDIAVIRATCATKDDVAMLLERMNRQHIESLEQTNKLRVELLERMNEQHASLLRRMDEQHAFLLGRMHEQQADVLRQFAVLGASIKEDKAQIYLHLSMLAWRVYGVIALAMSAAYFTARYVH